MYGLRSINNMYSEHAGKRSDFIVVGHPEFNQGKVGSSSGFGKGWADIPVPCYPKKSPAVANVIKQGGLAKKYQRLGLRPDEPAPNPRERALARSRSAAAGEKAHVDDGDVRHSFQAFLAALQDTSSLPTFRPDLMRVTQGAGNHSVEGSGCRRHAAFQDELEDLMKRLKQKPAETERDLFRTGSWKYFAEHLEVARRREQHFQRRGRSSLPDIKRHHKPYDIGLSGVVYKDCD